MPVKSRGGRVVFVFGAALRAGFGAAASATARARTAAARMPHAATRAARLLNARALSRTAPSARRRYCPVCDALTAATSSGVPSATIRPPPSPPSGPRSMTQSAVRMTSRLCSMTITVLPFSVSDRRTPSSFWMSSKWRPVVGSSSR